jgi:hypothetical protein
MRKRAPCNKFNNLRVITGVYKMRTSVKYDTLIAVLSSVLHRLVTLHTPLRISPGLYLRYNQTCNINNIRYLETDVRHHTSDIRYSRFFRRSESIFWCVYSMFRCLMRLFHPQSHYRRHLECLKYVRTNIIWIRIVCIK